MNVVEQTIECIGCGACADVCPVGALSMRMDTRGFYRPFLDQQTCIDCSHCSEVCAGLTDSLRYPSQERVCYSGFLKDINLRRRSTSGGAFTALAQVILSQNGVVFGASYADDFTSAVITSTEERSMEALRGTKYTQCYPNHVFSRVDEMLTAERPVLLVGTPCMICSARKRFGNSPLLTLVDFQCGGLMPASFLSDYVQDNEKRHKSRIASLNMRDKKHGWAKPHMRITFENGTVYDCPYQCDRFLFYYYKPYFKNEKCLHCPFVYHPDADLTLGDFWGYRSAGIKNSRDGISLIAVNTPKGEALLREASEYLTISRLTEESVSYAFREKSFSMDALAKRNAYQSEAIGLSLIDFANRHEFRHGIIGQMFRTAIHKLKR